MKHRNLFIVLLIGLAVWLLLFLITANSYLAMEDWTKMYAVIGPAPNPDTINIFGFAIPYQYEGFTDYAYYYVHWGNNVLNGVPLYSNDFGHIVLDGITNDVGAYIFPPLTAWLYALGVLIQPRIGIAIFIAGFGYLTAIPVYGIAKEFTNNEEYGVIAAATYLFNPLTLYYIAYLWLNPSIFYFFVIMGLWLLVRGNDISGSLFIITAALFKQTAWFIGIPLIIYLLIKDKKKFAEIAGIAAVYFGVIMIPFMYNLLGTISIWFRGLGAYSYQWGFDCPHDYGFPTTLTDTFINMGLYGVAELYYYISITGIFMFAGVAIIAVYMIKSARKNESNKLILKRLMFLTLIMLIWVHVFGPRGSFKYYLTFLVPFFCIFASSDAIKTKDFAEVSGWTKYAPLILGVIIFFIVRQSYLWFLLIVMIIYIDHENMGNHYRRLKEKLHDFKVTMKIRWGLLNKTEKKLIVWGIILMLMFPIFGYVISEASYYNGYSIGYIHGELSTQRNVIVEFSGLIEMPCARNITIYGPDREIVINSFWNFTSNFTFYAGSFYLGSIVYIDISLFFNITNGYNDNATLHGSYLVGSNPILENWLFIRDTFISMTKLQVYERKVLI